MWRVVSVSLCCAVFLLACNDASNRGGTVEVENPPLQLTQPIDWEQSAGVFIGIEQFHRGPDRPEPVDYAADDATDLAYFFAKEILLPARRTHLLLAGRPHKRETLQHLAELERDAAVVIAGGDVCLNAARIYAELDRIAHDVGPHGILIVSIATHGFTVGDQQLLLTCDSLQSKPKGVVLTRMLQALRDTARVLLLVDACRARRSDPPLAFEGLDLPSGYAVLSASSPGRKARSHPSVQNGLFTRAILEGLQCRADAGPDGAISSRELDVYVGPRVRRMSRGSQQPEGRFAGGIGDVELVNCSTPRVAKLLAPADGMDVKGSGRVDFRVELPDLYATVLVCATRNGLCYNQNPALVPIPTRRGRVTKVRAHYGAPDAFRVWVALTADRDFLRDRYQICPIPLDDRAQRIVYWLGPTEINFE